MKTVIISFSSRPNGNCSQIGKLISSIAQDPVLFDFSKFELHPCGHCAAECFAAREDCPYSEDKEYEILDAILHSDMFTSCCRTIATIRTPIISFSTNAASASSRGGRIFLKST